MIIYPYGTERNAGLLIFLLYLKRTTCQTAAVLLCITWYAKPTETDYYKDSLLCNQ
jgi:hypothetical protein